MAGTIEGGLITAQKNKAKDPDFYVKLGRKSQEAWIRNGRKPRGFSAMDKEKIKEAGRKGGSARRGYRKNTDLTKTPSFGKAPKEVVEHLKEVKPRPIRSRGPGLPKLSITNQEELDTLAQALQAEAKVVR